MSIAVYRAYVDSFIKRQRLSCVVYWTVLKKTCSMNNEYPFSLNKNRLKEVLRKSMSVHCQRKKSNHYYLRVSAEVANEENRSVEIKRNLISNSTFLCSTQSFTVGEITKLVFIVTKLQLDVQRKLYKTYKFELKYGRMAINPVYVNLFLCLFVRVIILICARRIKVFERTKYELFRV